MKLSTRAHRYSMRLAAVATLSIVSTGCANGLESLPLPAPHHVSRGIEITAVFANAMNLPAKAKVKLNGAEIGEVQSISAKNFAAYATLRINADAPLYAGAAAELRSATPLGDIFVAIRPNAELPSESRPLRDGDTIALTSTSSASTVEDVLGSAALLINGGVIRHLVTVVNGAGKAVGGRGTKVADLIHQSNTLIGRLNARSAQIDSALRNTSELAATLSGRSETLNRVLDAAAPATAVIADNTAQLADLTTALARITNQLNRFPAFRGTDKRSMIADLNTLSAAMNDLATDPTLNLNTWNRVFTALVKLTSGPNIHAAADIAQLAFGALPDKNYPGDPMFHGADGTDWHAAIGSLRYEWNLLLGRIYGPEHRPRP